jgi:hypothetical protein
MPIKLKAQPVADAIFDGHLSRAFNLKLYSLRRARPLNGFAGGRR